ncbi:MAG TPA: hypothetical protein VGE99_07945 [Candidatus Dormibacteraeota bacterium]
MSRDEADPANRIPVRGAGVAGLTGSGLGAGSGGSRRWGACLAAELAPGSLEVDLGAC